MFLVICYMQFKVNDDGISKVLVMHLQNCIKKSDHNFCFARCGLVRLTEHLMYSRLYNRSVKKSATFLAVNGCTGKTVAAAVLETL